MNQDLVIGLDASTTATKAIAWNRHGQPLAEGRSPIPMDSPAPNYYEQDPEDWWRSALAALVALCQQLDPARVAALAIANQRETFVPLDAAGQALRPGIVWLDERCRPEVAGFAGRVGEHLIHEISGKPADVTPSIYRIAWLARHEPEILRRCARFCDVQGFLALRLTGHCRSSWASADPMGCFDMLAHDWSDTVLAPLGLSSAQFPETLAPGRILGRLHESAAHATGLPVGTPLVAGAGDGQAAGLGCGLLTPGRAYLNLGTAVVSGIYSADYRVDPAFRTMGSGSGEGYILESVLRTGTFLVDWFVERLFGLDPSHDPGIYHTLEQEAAAVGPGAGGLLLVPYWAGVMGPYWEHEARGCMVGLSASHGRSHVYRAVLEGIALEQTLVTDATEAVCGEPVTAYAAIGGGAASDLWCQIIADTSGRAVQRSATVEAASLGAAMAAAVGVGWFGDFADAAAAMGGTLLRRFQPRPEAALYYRRLLAIYRRLYPGLRETYQSLAALARDGAQVSSR